MTIIHPSFLRRLGLCLLLTLGVGATGCSLFERTATPIAADSTPGLTVTTTLTIPPAVTPGLTLTPTATLTPTISPTPTATLTPAPSFTPTPGPSPTPTIDPGSVGEVENPHIVVNVEKDDVLNVRAGAGADQPVVGALPPYCYNVSVTGAGVSVGESLWEPVRFEELAGWVNSAYLADQKGQAETGAVARALEIVIALRDRDLTTLAGFVDPQTGLKFSPYAYITEDDLVFSAEQLPTLLADPTLHDWGFEAGSGDPIVLTFADYYARFVYRYNYFDAQRVGLNAAVSSGSMIDNSRQLYPDAAIIEYHFDGFDPMYQGMDWHSLRLILQPVNGQWLLVNVVNDEWTP